MGKKKTKAKFPPSSPPVEEDDLEAALAASRAQLAALEVRAQTRANAVAAEAAAAAASAAAAAAAAATQAAEAEIEAGKSLHAKDADFASSVPVPASPSSSLPTADIGGDEPAGHGTTDDPVDSSPGAADQRAAAHASSVPVNSATSSSTSSTAPSTPSTASSSSASSAPTGAGDLSAGDLRIDHFAISADDPAHPAASGSSVADVGGVLAAIAELSEQQRRETAELRRERQALADEQQLQRKNDLMDAAAQRVSDQADVEQRFAQLRQGFAAPISVSSGAAASAVPEPAIPGDRRDTVFRMATQRDGVVTTEEVAARLPRGLTDPNFSDLPQFSGDDTQSYADWEAAILAKLVMVPSSSRGVYLRAALVGRMKHAVDQDLAALGISVTTVPEASLILDLARTHAFRPSTTVEAFGKAVDLRQKSAGGFSVFFADFSRLMSSAGINMMSDVIDADAWNFLRIAALSHSVHSSVYRELLKHPQLFSGSFEAFRASCASLSESLGHQAHGVHTMGGGEGDWSNPVQGSVPDAVFEHPWDNVKAWAARFPGQTGCGFCARSRKDTDKSSSGSHLIPMCANMYRRNEKQSMSPEIVARVTRELREVNYPMP